jgi:hypothetical protein
VKSITHHLWAGVFISLFTGLSVAGTSAGLFSVSITLNNPGFVAPPMLGTPVGVATLRSGVCISETFSQQAQASVRVVCATGQFVSIAPWPGKPFLGTHGGAFRYSMGVGKFSAPSLSSKDNPYIGVDAVTALPIYSANDTDGPLEMLVSF